MTTTGGPLQHAQTSWPGLAAIAAMALLALTAGQALANHVQCGDVITQDTTLDSDMSCPGDAVSIGAADVTLDLGGHSIGPGAEVRSTGISHGDFDSNLPRGSDP